MTKPGRAGGREGQIGGVFAVLLGLAFVLWGVPGAVFASVYEVKDVVVQVSSQQNPFTIGLAEAGKQAFDRLLRRMMTKADQAIHRDFLDDLKRDRESLTERAVVRSERRRGRVIILTVDVTFSKKRLESILSRMGLSYNQTRHPQLLVRVVEPDEAGAVGPAVGHPLEEAVLAVAVDLGLPVVQPLFDPEDRRNLAPERLEGAGSAVLPWAFQRYGSERIGLFRTTSGQQPGRQGARYFLAGELLEIGPEGSGVVRARLNGLQACKQGGLACHYRTLADQVLQRAADRWIMAHTINPELRHTTLLRVVHGTSLSSYAAFIAKLQGISGMSEVRFLSMEAREAQLELHYQGSNDNLKGAVRRLGVRLEWGDQEVMTVRLP